MAKGQDLEHLQTRPVVQILPNVTDSVTGTLLCEGSSESLGVPERKQKQQQQQKKVHLYFICVCTREHEVDECVHPKSMFDCNVSARHDTHTHTHTQPGQPEGTNLEPLFCVKVGLDVRHARAGNRVDGMQWHNAILFIKDLLLHIIEMRRDGPQRQVRRSGGRFLFGIRLWACRGGGGARRCCCQFPRVLCAA